MSFPFTNAKGWIYDAENLPVGAVLRVALQREAYLIKTIEQDAEFITDLADFDEPVDASYARIALQGADIQRNITLHAIEFFATKATFPALDGGDLIYGVLLYYDPDGTDTDAQNKPLVFSRAPAVTPTDGTDYEHRWNDVDGLGLILRGI